MKHGVSIRTRASGEPAGAVPWRQGCEGDYGAGFSPDDFGIMADQLERIAGRFVLSINDTPIARAAFGRFQLEEVETTYTLSTATTGSGKRVGELIVSNAL